VRRAFFVDSDLLAWLWRPLRRCFRGRIVVAPLGCASRFSALPLRTVAAISLLRTAAWRLLLCMARLTRQELCNWHARPLLYYLQRSAKAIRSLASLACPGGAPMSCRRLERGLTAGACACTLGYLTDEQLAQVLSGARALVFRPCMQGFWLTRLLEAMASGVPVVLTSRGGSRRSSRGGQGTYIDALDVEDCMQAIGAL